TPWALVAPVQVSSSLPSLARTRETVPPPPELATHRSAPSDSTNSAVVPTVVVPRPPDELSYFGVVVQNCRSAARLLPRLSAESCVRVMNAAIWSRVTVPVGLYVVADVPLASPEK